MVLFTLFYDGDTNCKALCSVTTLNVIPYVFGGRGGDYRFAVVQLLSLTK